MSQHTPRNAHKVRALAVGALAIATVGAALALPSPASAAASNGNVSNNPTVSRNLSGYSVITGARRLTRVKIHKLGPARHAVRAVATGKTVKIREPREAVSPGSSWYFSSNVKASRGSRSQLSILWYDAQGRYLGSRAGAVRGMTGGWKLVNAASVVPSSARAAQSVVTVTGTHPRAKVYVTNHVVRRPGTAAGSLGYYAQPGLVAYGSASAAAPFAHAGALVIAGRDNYNAPQMKAVSAAGGTVLVYLDALVDNPEGRYASMLYNSSACGPAVPRWPGSPKVSQWGYLADFRVGSVLQNKLQCVLEAIVNENPHIGGFFADDLGSRSYFPDLNWNTFGSSNQQAYRNGAIALSKTFRKVSDEHGLIFLVNGTWGGGSLASAGGGYPNMNENGNALADGAMAEWHTADAYWGRAYPCSPQWAAQSATTHGRAVNFAVTTTNAARIPFARSGCYTHVAAQVNYTTASVWASFRSIGLPTRVSN